MNINWFNVFNSVYLGHLEFYCQIIDKHTCTFSSSIKLLHSEIHIHILMSAWTLADRISECGFSVNL